MMFVGSFIEGLIPMMIFAIPIVAIIGGITAGIVKTLSDSRIIENVQRERLAAIERGIDPAKLPSLPTDLGAARVAEVSGNPEAAAHHRSSALLIWGLIVLFFGIGLSTFLYLQDLGGTDWAVGLIPGFVGLALLLSGYLTRPRSYARPQG